MEEDELKDISADLGMEGPVGVPVHKEMRAELIGTYHSLFFSTKMKSTKQVK